MFRHCKLEDIESPQVGSKDEDVGDDSTSEEVGTAVQDIVLHNAATDVPTNSDRRHSLQDKHDNSLGGIRESPHSSANTLQVQ